MTIDRHGLRIYPTTAPLEVIFTEGLDLCPSCDLALKPKNQMVCDACQTFLVEQESSGGIWQ